MEKTGVRETTWLFVMIMIFDVCFGEISSFTQKYGNAAYIPVALSSLVVLLLCVFLCTATRKTDFYDLFKGVYGKKLSFVIYLFLFGVTVINSGADMNVFSSAIRETVLRESPDMFILLLMSFSVFTVCILKLEAITRYSLATFLVFLVFLLVILLSVITEIDAENIYPLFGKGNIMNFTGTTVIFSDIIYFFLIRHHIADSKNSSKVIYRAVLISGILAVALSLFYTLCVPYPLSRVYRYPLQRISLLSNSSVIFQRIDGLCYLIWTFITFISAGAKALFAVMIFKRAFNIKNQNAVAFATVFICFAVSALNLNLSYVLRYLMPLLSFGLLPVTCLIYRIKMKEVKNV